MRWRRGWASPRPPCTATSTAGGSSSGWSGESLLAELDLRDDPDADTEEHLVSFATQLQVSRDGSAPRPRRSATRVATRADVVISLAACAESNAGATGGDHPSGFAAERDAVADRLAGDPQLGVSQVSNAEFVRLLVAASIRGLVAVIAPGRPIDEVVAELGDTERDR